MSVKASVGVTPRAKRVSTVVVISTLSPGFTGEITPPLERVQGPGPMKANCPAVVQALDPFWHWYNPVAVEQNEFAAPVVGGLVEQAAMVPPLPPLNAAEGEVPLYPYIRAVMLECEPPEVKTVTCKASQA